MVRNNIVGGCASCDGEGMSGGSRRKQFHMLHSQMGVDQRRQNQVINSDETMQQKPTMSGMGMGFRDPTVRMAHRDRARLRAMEDPRYSHWRGSGAVEGGNWFTDAWGKVKNEFVNPNSKLRGEIVPKVAHEAYKVARPLVEKVGNELGKQVGVENLGTYADQGLKLTGHGRKGRKRVAKLGRKQLADAMASGKAYQHDNQWWVEDKPMSVDDMHHHMMSGGGFWGDVWNGVKKVGRAVVAPAGNALGALVGMPMAGTFADQGLKLAGLGKRGGKKEKAEAESDSDSDGASSVAGGRRPKAKRRPMSASDGRMKRI